MESIDIFLADEEYRDMLTTYISIYSEILKVLPRKKRKLLVDFNEITEKIIQRRYQLYLNNEAGE